MAEHGSVSDETWQLLSGEDAQSICSRLWRAQMTLDISNPVERMWPARYAQDIPILLDALTKGEQRISRLEAALRQMQDCIGDVLAGCCDPAHRGRD